MKSKYIAFYLFFGITTQFSFSQTNTALLDHYKSYYAQMQKQGDVQVLTRVQAFALDAHFTLEQVGRNAKGHFINFNVILTYGLVKSFLKINATKIIDQFVVYNLLGNKVTYGSPKSLLFNIDMGDLKSGVYFIKFGFKHISKTIKIIKI